MKEESLNRIEPNIHLNHITVFDIGANKEYFNKGMIQNEIRTTIPKNIDKIFEIKQNRSLAIPGYVLEQLSKEQPETLKKIKDYVASKKIVLAAQPYFGTSMQLLSDKEAIEHILKHQNILEKTLGKKAEIALLDKKPTPSLLKSIHCKRAIVSEEKNLTEMQKHLVSELESFSTHVKKTEDTLLLNDFHLLSNSKLINSVNVDDETNESPYEQYSTMLTILNDIAHKINNAKLSEKGEFQLETELSDNPSSLIK